MRMVETYKKLSEEEYILLAKILSDTTRKYDLTDKFIQYQTIETLMYYRCIEPKQQGLMLKSKQDGGEWMEETFTKDEHVISLAKRGNSFIVKDVYEA